MTPNWRRRARCRVRVGGEDWMTSGTRSARRRPLMLKAGTVQGGKESLLGTAEEVEALDGAAFDGTGSGKTVERSDASREVVQTGEVFDIAAVATEQDVTEVGKAVNVLF